MCMMCKKSMRICPVSLGLALGITSGLAMFIWAMWLMLNGLPPAFEAKNLPPLTWADGLTFAMWTAIKGFFFGFVLALFYDMFVAVGKRWCTKKDKCCACGDACKCSGMCNCCKEGRSMSGK